MAPCEVESRPQGQKNWVALDTLRPGDKPAIISVSSDETIQMFVIQCDPDGSSTTVYRSYLGSDFALVNGEPKLVKPIEDLKVVKKLKEGESFEFTGTSAHGIKGLYKLTHAPDEGKS